MNIAQIAASLGIALMIPLAVYIIAKAMRSESRKRIEHARTGRCMDCNAWFTPNGTAHTCETCSMINRSAP